MKIRGLVFSVSRCALRRLNVTRLTVFVAITALAVLLPVSIAKAAPRVDRYEPAMASPDDVVTIHGSGWGTRKPGHDIRYGTGAAPMGTAAITSWADRSIRAHLPRSMPDGLYWLAIYENDNLKSNQLRELRIGKRTGKGPGKGGGPGIIPGAFGRDRVREGALERGRRPSGTPAVDDLAIVGIDPPVGAEVSPLGQSLAIRVSVRNMGGRTRRFLVSATGGTTPLVTSETMAVRPGQTVAVPIDIGAPPNLIRSGEFRTTVALGTRENPVAFTDANRANNAFGVRYRIPTYVLTATVERVDVRDDCDNVSEGDWVFDLQLGVGRLREDGHSYTVARRERTEWRRDVDSGSGYNFDESVRLTGVQWNDPIIVALFVIDCDMDGIFALPTLFEAGYAFSTWQMTCSGEEIIELSGDNDFVGDVKVPLTPEAWQRGGTYNRDADNHDCGNRPYRARISLRAERE